MFREIAFWQVEVFPATVENPAATPGMNARDSGIWLGLVWLLVNWGFDIIAIVPFAGMTRTRYFAEIGLRYLGFRTSQSRRLA